VAEEGVVVAERRLRPLDVAEALRQLEQRRLRRPLAAACEHGDRPAVVGAGGERAADGELDPGSDPLSAPGLSRRSSR
jgi:hypothetical protein